jgi:hypothetical protein
MQIPIEVLPYFYIWAAMPKLRARTQPLKQSTNIGKSTICILITLDREYITKRESREDFLEIPT